MLDANVSMYDYYLHRTEKLPYNTRTLSFYGKVINKRNFVKHVEAFAGYLQSININKGDNVIICLGNIPNAIISFYAVNLIGGIANVVHPLMPCVQLENIASKTKSKAFIMLDEFLPKYESIISDKNNIIVSCSASDYLPKSFGIFYKLYINNKTKNIVKKSSNITTFSRALKLNLKLSRIVVSGDDIAVYMHSSGSTGEPKTAMISNKAYNYYADSMINHFGDKQTYNERMLMVLPIFHTFGLGVCMHTILVSGGMSVLMPKFNGKKACGLIKKNKCTMLAGVPNMYAKIVESGKFEGKYLLNIRACYCGGDKLPESLQNSFCQQMQKQSSNVRISQGYGLTEAGVCLINGDKHYKEGSLGQVVKHSQACVIDENGIKLAPNIIGELCIAGQTLMNGYHDDIELTKQVMFADDEGTVWLRTGDFAYIDEQNYVFYVDRKKRLIKISGINVFPSEIESVVNTLPFIDKCCAVGYVENNKNFIKLFVVLSNKLCDEQEICKQIKLKIQKNLLKYAMPQRIEIVQSLPLTEIGKVDFKKLEQL